MCLLVCYLVLLFVIACYCYCFSLFLIVSYYCCWILCVIGSFCLFLFVSVPYCLSLLMVYCLLLCVIVLIACYILFWCSYDYWYYLLLIALWVFAYIAFSVCAFVCLSVCLSVGRSVGSLVVDLRICFLVTLFGFSVGRTCSCWSATDRFFVGGVFVWLTKLGTPLQKTHAWRDFAETTRENTILPKFIMLSRYWYC